MKFGVREICDVVFRAKASQKIGNRIFHKDEPVIYFDSLKTSTLEGAATTVYAQGGRGNARLVAWEGERTVTFTMEDALISPLGLMILTGAGLTEGADEEGKKIQVHTTDTIGKGEGLTIEESKITIALSAKDPISTVDNKIYVMPLINGEIQSEPYFGNAVGGATVVEIVNTDAVAKFANADAVLVDYYTDKGAGTQQVDIKADSFGGNFYVEASTLFRTQDGVDMPAEFIIPNAKIQSNFTFTMASSGDPSTFTFTLDAFPDYTRFDKSEKVFFSIQIVTEDGDDNEYGTRAVTVAKPREAVEDKEDPESAGKTE